MNKEKMNKKYIISYERLKELLERDKELYRLEAGGVDNWYCDDEYFEDYDTEDLINKYQEYTETKI